MENFIIISYHSKPSVSGQVLVDDDLVFAYVDPKCPNWFCDVKTFNKTKQEHFYTRPGDKKLGFFNGSVDDAGQYM